MRDELRGHLPAPGVAFAPAGVVLQAAGEHHARDRGLDEVCVGVGHPARGVADLVAVRGERLATRVRPQRKAQREAPEEGLFPEELGHAGTDAQRGLVRDPCDHHAASRAGSVGGAK